MEDEAKVELKVTMTPEQYISIKKNATWDGLSVADYLVANATGNLPRGC